MQPKATLPVTTQVGPGQRFTTLPLYVPHVVVVVDVDVDVLVDVDVEVVVDVVVERVLVVVGGAGHADTSDVQLAEPADV